MDRMQGKNVVITGANSGIGLETAKILAGMGASLLITCRTAAKGKAAADEISKHANGSTVQSAEVDLSSFASVRSGADEIGSKLGHIDVLINNAGVFPPSLRKTADGFEETNRRQSSRPFFAHHLLKAKLDAADAARIVHISSQMHAGGEIDFDNFRGEKGYDAMGAYRQSKLANILFSNELAERWSGVTSNALHPGAIRTAITRDANFLIRLFTRLTFKPVGDGAKTPVYLASSDEVSSTTGKYLKTARKRSPTQSRMITTQRKNCGKSAPNSLVYRFFHLSGRIHFSKQS